MPTRSLALLILTIIAIPSEGQGQDRGASLGVLAGANVADQAGQDVFAPHDRFGFIGGVSAAVRVGSRWTVQLDGLFVQKGGRENNDMDPDDAFDDELALEYVEFPLLLKFSFTDGGTRPHIFAGPSLAFELACTYDAFPGGSSAPVECADAGLQTRSPDLGIAFGADVEIPVGFGHLVIDGRGIVGLASFDDSEADLDFRNRILALTFGYRFAL